MKTSKPTYSKSAIAADALAVAYFVVGNVVLFLGEVTTLLSAIGGRHPGAEFIYRYFSAPAYRALGSVYRFTGSDTLIVYLEAELVLLVASVTIGLVVYGLLRLMSLFRV